MPLLLLGLKTWNQHICTLYRKKTNKSHWYCECHSVMWSLCSTTHQCMRLQFFLLIHSQNIFSCPLCMGCAMWNVLHTPGPSVFELQSLSPACVKVDAFRSVMLSSFTTLCTLRCCRPTLTCMFGRCRKAQTALRNSWRCSQCYHVYSLQPALYDPSPPGPGLGLAVCFSFVWFLIPKATCYECSGW